MMANRVSGSEGWRQLHAIARSNFVGPSSRMRSQCRMCPALASPELLLLVLVWGKWCKSVPGGWVGWWIVRKLLPLESEVLLCPLCPLRWEALSSLSSSRKGRWSLIRTLVGLGGVSSSEAAVHRAVAWLQLVILVHCIRFWAGFLAGSRAGSEDVRSHLWRIAIRLGIGPLLRSGCFSMDAGGSSGSEVHHSWGWSHAGNGARLCVWLDL